MHPMKKQHWRQMAPVLFLLLGFSGLNSAAQPAEADNTRVNVRGTHSFSLPVANMPLMQRLDFSVGNSFFRNPWVASPASTDARDGLGPLFNTNACQNCHIKDGRGHPPQGPDDNAVSLLVRLSIPSSTPLPPWQANLAEPIYGGQLQDFSLPGLKPEAKISINYSDEPRVLAGGERVILRRPTLSFSQLSLGPMAADVQTSVRIAPAMIGLGLLEAIPAKKLLQMADPQDQNDDEISGRVNRVWDQQKRALVIGRFGWKAGQPSLLQQNAAAFNGDMGISSSLFEQENCTALQARCMQLAQATVNPKSKDEPEISDHLLDLVTFYSRNLAVPKRRQAKDKQVKQGEQLFSAVGCGGCHQAQHTTSGTYPLAWLRNKTIAPYTDLLLHDMGDDLADNAPEFLATGREWRTPPLWGIGMVKRVNGIEAYLHDGRARTLQEAILWHGGEAQAAREAYSELNQSQRQSLIKFLQDL